MLIADESMRLEREQLIARGGMDRPVSIAQRYVPRNLYRRNAIADFTIIARTVIYNLIRLSSVEEQLTVNQLVLGSNPRGGVF